MGLGRPMGLSAKLGLLLAPDLRQVVRRLGEADVDLSRARADLSQGLAASAGINLGAAQAKLREALGALKGEPPD